MFAYWLVNLLKATKSQKPINISQIGITPTSIHHLDSIKGMLNIGDHKSCHCCFRRTVDLLNRVDNYIAVSG